MGEEVRSRETVLDLPVVKAIDPSKRIVIEWPTAVSVGGASRQIAGISQVFGAGS